MERRWVSGGRVGSDLVMGIPQEWRIALGVAVVTAARKTWMLLPAE